MVQLLWAFYRLRDEPSQTYSPLSLSCSKYQKSTDLLLPPPNLFSPPSPRSPVGVGEAGDRQRRPEGSDRGAEAAEAAAGLHAQPAPAHLHRPRPERPNARGRAEPLPPAHQGEHVAVPQHHCHHRRLLLVLLLVRHASSGRRSSEPRSRSLSQSHRRSAMSD